jgi:4-diphosphocytidyl-2-C-methyl-D-erythritol kinase
MSPECKTARLSNGCKINVGLRVTGVRADGYHELDSFFYPLPHPRDELTTRRVRRDGIRVVCDSQHIEPDNNTLTRAYTLFEQATGGSPGIEVFLRKRVPVGAGLGGGSGNAAALLLWLNRENGFPLSPESLAAVALGVGADTPFFLRNCPCRVRGIGELLMPVNRFLAGFWLVLVCPVVQVSTRNAYAEYDHLPPPEKFLEMQNNLTEFALQAKKSPLFSLLHAVGVPLKGKGGLVNDLEAAVFPSYPSLASIKAELSHLGADAACMSGSGASLFGLFSPHRAEMARKAACSLRSGQQRVFLLRL